MKMKNKTLVAAAIAATLTLGACSEGVEDDGVVDDTVDGVTATTLVPDSLPDTMPSDTTGTTLAN